MTGTHVATAVGAVHLVVALAVAVGEFAKWISERRTDWLAR